MKAVADSAPGMLVPVCEVRASATVDTKSNGVPAHCIFVRRQRVTYLIPRFV